MSELVHRLRNECPEDEEVLFTEAADHIEELEAQLASARKDALLEAAKVIEGCYMITPSPIGPLHGVGWSEAVSLIEKRIHKLLEPKGDSCT